MIETLLKMKAAAPGVIFVVLFVCERLRPAVGSKGLGPRDDFAPNAAGRRGRLLRNAGMWAFFLAASPLIAFPISVYAAAHAIWPREGWVASPGLILVDLAILDLWTYALHRAYHQIPALWRLHAPHHFDEHLDTTTAGRIHFGEIIVSALLRAPLIMAFAIPLAHVAVYDALLMCAAIFHHSNLRLPARLERALSCVIVTPSTHWVHHHARRADTDSNYGGVFSLWDRLFDSRSRTQRTAEMKIGVEAEPDRPLWMLLLFPLAPRSSAR